MGSSLYGRSVLVGTGVAFSVLPIITVSLRFYARSISRAKLGADDWIMIPALVIIVALGVTQIISAEIGELGEHQTLGPDGQLVLTPQLVNYEKCKYILQVLGQFELAVVKVSILLFYRRIFTVRSFRIIDNFAIALTIIWGMAFTLAVTFQCTPISTIWTQFEMNYTPYCTNQRQYYLAGAVSSLILDFMVFALPFPPLMKLKMSPKQKLGVASIFLLGSIVVGVGLTRVIIFAQTIKWVKANPLVFFTDVTFYTANTLFWTLIENSVAIIGACIPALRPLFTNLQQPKPSWPNPYEVSSRGEPFTSRQKINDRSSIDSGSASRRIETQQSHPHEDYIEMAPQKAVPENGIMVQTEFYGGTV